MASSAYLASAGSSLFQSKRNPGPDDVVGVAAGHGGDKRLKSTCAVSSRGEMVRMAAKGTR